MSCGSKRYCTQMTSCAEAQFYFRQCGLSRLDGDRDGVPCEQLCR
ncbi:excalibur calcium-binding domain-containing protein [Teichococcus wenyumeiae]|nr:excalibur calcium-binding domain-containing protein [Pseudoroseomonas wenyumeiae]